MTLTHLGGFTGFHTFVLLYFNTRNQFPLKTAYMLWYLAEMWGRSPRARATTDQYGSRLYSWQLALSLYAKAARMLSSFFSLKAEGK